MQSYQNWTILVDKGIRLHPRPKCQCAPGQCFGLVDLLSRGLEVLFRAVSTSLYLALAMTESIEKKEPYNIMQSQV